MIKYKQFLILISFYMFLVSACIPRGCWHKDDIVYFRLEKVRGHVEIYNRWIKEKMPFNGIEIVFQRTDCKRCTVVAYTDIDGNYEVTLSEGVYKIIMRYVRGGGAPSYDFIAPDQIRTLKVTHSLDGTRFDIRALVPDYEHEPSKRSKDKLEKR